MTLALWVHRRALDGFFGPDDFIYLERARGILPPLDLLWRAIPGRLWFRRVDLFGSDPRAWFAANLGLHALNVALLFALVRGWPAGTVAAFAAAATFGVSRLHVTALGQVATASELLACALTLCTLILARRRGRPAAIGSARVFRRWTCRWIRSPARSSTRGAHRWESPRWCVRDIGASRS